MEEDREKPPGSPPFWEPQATRRRDFKLWVFAVFFVLILSLLYFYLPPFFANVARIFRAYHVKKSWDALNLFLVFFAIVCGFLSRNPAGNGGSGEVAYAAVTPTAVENNGGLDKSTPRSESRPRSPGIAIPKWFQQYNYSYGYNVIQTTEETEGSLRCRPLRRSSSSYPDLRQEEWATENRRRFHDDTEVAARPRSAHRRRQHGNLNEVNDSKLAEPEGVISDNGIASATMVTPPEDHKAAEDSLPQVPDVSPPQRSRLRESSSYPDLRKEELRGSETGRLSWDDSEVSSQRRSEHRRHRRRRSYGGDFVGNHRDVPTIFVDKHVLHQSGSGVSPPSSSPQPPKPKSSHKFEALSRVAKSKSESYVRETRKKPPPPPPPPPPRADHKKSDKTRTRGAAKDIATALASFYNQKKLKKHKNRISNSSSGSDEAPTAPSYPPPPPPPPPPPATSVFYNWFSQKKLHKAKKNHAIKTSSLTPPPPPPPPPPPRPSRNEAPQPEFSRSKHFDHMRTQGSLSRGGQSPLVSVAPRSPPSRPPRNVVPRPEFSRSGHFDHLMAGDYLSSGGQSPLVPVAPPPPPPFQMKDVKFKRKGDFVRVRSLLGEVSDSEAGDISDREFAEDRNVSLFCPSPTVDLKADTFIARFRAGLRLEKLNSLREKEVGPGSGPS
ncbi:formin-like protein 20 [Aristolochia californica]|uniref:formin-like protein 20 n=1 Tax=Aristolochia californica TaxID=171875 RepID=UPI0035DAE617